MHSNFLYSSNHPSNKKNWVQILVAASHAGILRKGQLIHAEGHRRPASLQTLEILALNYRYYDRK